jgi:hypothetical protein
MLALYLKCMMIDLALPSLITMSLIVLLLLYVYKRVYALSFEKHVLGEE